MAPGRQLLTCPGGLQSQECVLSLSAARAFEPSSPRTLKPGRWKPRVLAESGPGPHTCQLAEPSESSRDESRPRFSSKQKRDKNKWKETATELQVENAVVRIYLNRAFSHGKSQQHLQLFPFLKILLVEPPQPLRSQEHSSRVLIFSMLVSVLNDLCPKASLAQGRGRGAEGRSCSPLSSGPSWRQSRPRSGRSCSAQDIFFSPMTFSAWREKQTRIIFQI